MLVYVLHVTKAYSNKIMLISSTVLNVKVNGVTTTWGDIMCLRRFYAMKEEENKDEKDKDV